MGLNEGRMSTGPGGLTRGWWSGLQGESQSIPAGTLHQLLHLYDGGEASQRSFSEVEAWALRQECCP